MHSGEPPLRDIYYGSDGENLFVRVDGAGSAAVGIEFEDGPAEVKIARRYIVEMEAPRVRGRFRIVVNRDGLPPATFPPEGWLEAA
jgi:hypothetical protein